jgi:hypothetical protein
VAAPTIKTGLDTTNPMVFAKTRHGYLIGVNGVDRGIFWDGRSAAANELGVDPPSTPPVMLTPKVEKQATATILIATGTAANLNNEYITIKDAFGKTVKYLFRATDPPGAKIGGRFKSTYSETDDGYPGGEVYVDIYGLSTAANIAEYLLTTILGDLGHDGSITVTRDSATLTLTQIQGGTSGNNTITTDIDAAHATIAGFAGGVSTGRSGFAVINVAEGTTAHGLTAGQKITLTSTDGTIVDYFVSDTGDGGVAHLSPVTGGATLKSTGSITATLTTGATGISVGFNLSSGNQNAYLVLLKAAIEHANGHNTKLIVSAVPSATSGEDKITVHQATSGPEGNTTVTENLTTVSSTAFTGGTNVLGATGGDYTCFYRYVDEREGARFYSNLSPFWVTTADADDGFFWKDLTASSQTRVTHVQLLRTTFNQATTAYVVAMLPQNGSCTEGTGSAGAGVDETGGKIRLNLPLGHGIVAGMRVTVSGSNVLLHNQTFEIASVTTTAAIATVGFGTAATSDGTTPTWVLEGYTADKITDGQMVLFRGDYRQKLLQTDGRPAANRHAVPPFFKSVCCAFQDRMTYLVDPEYSTGTIAATANTTTINGTNTAWSSDLEGRLICPNPTVDTSTYTIVTVTNATTLTVDKALPTIASSTTYTIINPPEERNTIYISEQDLPESVITQIALQENVRDEDELVGAIVMGAQYYALKEHSIYRVTWAKNPLLDAQPQLAAMRGAINHNCADQHENILYIMDEEGPYAFQGGVQPIGTPIADQWSDQLLDFSKKSTWSVRVDPLEELVYFFVTGVGDSGDRPRRSLVYDIRTQTWTKWTYSWDIGDSVKLTYNNQRRLLMGVTNDAFYVCNEGLKDGTSNVSYNWKSGMFAWVESDQNTKRYFRVTFKPTNNDATLNIKKYDNHSTSPAALNEWNGGDGVSIVQGATEAVANLKLTQHEDGDEPGSKSLPWSGKLPFLRGRPIRWVTCELSGEQSDDRIIIYEIEIGGVK